MWIVIECNGRRNGESGNNRFLLFFFSLLSREEGKESVLLIVKQLALYIFISHPVFHLNSFHRCENGFFSSPILKFDSPIFNYFTG